jgi:hypothetical protein
MKHTLKLLTLSLLAVIFLGCAEANPHLGKWHGNVEGGNFFLEILEGGNLIITVDEESGIGKWNTSEGGIIVVINDQEGSGFLHEGSLLLSNKGKTYTFKRVNQ